MHCQPSTPAATPSAVPIFLEGTAGQPLVLLKGGGWTAERLLQLSVMLPVFVLGCSLVAVPAVGLSAGLRVLLSDLRVVLGLALPAAALIAMSTVGYRREAERLATLQDEVD